jgi:CheY-like chemotaxis protein
VNDVLQISRADAGKLDIAREPFSLPALLAELIDSQRGLAEHRGNTLGLRIGAGTDGWVAGDPTRLRQVLLNLVGNAIKFTRNGAIEVAVERAGPDLLFRVSDTGIGVPPADRERIFEEFVTLDASYARSAGGTGLGLAITRRLVLAMGGDIRVEDGAVGAGGADGSVFAFRLPLPPVEVENTGAGDDPAVPHVAGARPLRVLVVEDNGINRLVVREMLEQGGHAVEEAHDGQEGVAMATRRTYDLVFMDISMPVLDGVEATRMIRAAETPGRHVPIVALTAHALPGEIDRFRDAGLDDVLVKPISRASLAAVVMEVSGRGPTAEAILVGNEVSRAATLLDETHIAEMRTLLGAERTARQIGLFLVEADEFVAEMSRAVAAGANAGAIRASVHRMAGSAAILGATALREHLQQLEAGLAADPDTTRMDVGALQAVALDTLREMRRVRTQLVPPDQT